MNKILLVILMAALICLSGCINPTIITPTVDPVITPTVDPVVTPTADPVVTPTVDPVVTPTVDPVVTPIITEYNKFQEFLLNDNISDRTYNNDQTVPYPDRYICSHFARDFVKSATNTGYKVYVAWLTGTTKPAKNTVWHMINVVKLDGIWYFVEPQNDQIISMDDAYNYFEYEYAYIGKNIIIQRNDGVLTDRIRYEDGLINGEFIYLK